MTPEMIQQMYQADPPGQMPPEMQQWQQMLQQWQMGGAQMAGADSPEEEAGEASPSQFNNAPEKRQRLPAWAARQEFLKLMHANQVLLLVGEPGSGKTTQLPQILLDAGYHVMTNQPGQVKSICCALAGVQPNRLATISAATRICEELEVQAPWTHKGATWPFGDRTSNDTLLRFMTDEALFREALEDPLLERYSVIILDEAMG
eukprot:Skav229752  [mRNA]  locus=scaffold1796:41141:46236:- [translate_table: standard]